VATIDPIFDLPGATTADAFSIADAGFRSVEARINFAGDQDWFRVRLDVGQTYRFSTIDQGLVDSTLALRDSAGVQIGFDDDGGPGAASLLIFTPTADGTFYVDIGDFGDNGTGNYALDIAIEDVAATTSTTAFIPLGDTTFGTIAGSADQDWYRVDLVAGRQYILEAKQVGSFDPILRLRDASGTELRLDDDSGPGRSSLLVYTPTSTGAYYLDVRGFASSAGDFLLDARADDFVDTIDNASSRILFAGNAPLQGTIGSAADQDVVAFSVQTGRSYRFDVTGATLSDPTLELLSNLGVQLASSDDVNGRNPQINYTATFDGLVYLSVGGFSTQTGTYALTGVGTGNETYFPSAGNDFIDAGPGTDTVDFQFLAGPITVDLAIQTSQNTGTGTDTLKNFENATGTAQGDTMRGNASANVFQGLAGNDTLEGREGDDVLLGFAGDDVLRGGSGNDTLEGEAGSDTATYSEFAGAVTVDLALVSVAQNTGAGGSDTLFQVENLSGGSGDDTLRGDGLGNTLSGNAGNDTLDGRAGNDTLNGNSGNDTLFGGDGNDTLRGGTGNDFASGGAGSDTASYFDIAAAVTVDLAILVGQNTIGAGIDTLQQFENLSGGAGADTLRGDGNGNTLGGNGGNDLLEGRSGNDTLNGGDGNDTLRGGTGNDVLNGGAGTDLASYFDATAGVAVDLNLGGSQNTLSLGFDTLQLVENVSGGNFADTLLGNGGANSLFGNGGNDVLTGRGGLDVLAGGSGNDRFVYLATSDAATGGSTQETISDFTVGQDKIVLSAIDANITAAAVGNQAFAFIGSGGFSGVAGQLRYVGGLVTGDVNGDTVADFIIRIGNGAALTGTSFDL